MNTGEEISPKSPKSPANADATSNRILRHIEEFTKQSSLASSKIQSPKQGGGKKASTKYNIFMKSELERLKLKKPNADYKTRLKEAANNWKKNNK
jgi:hypothetical protein